MRKLILFVSAMMISSAAIAEVPGDDHPLLPRYEGAEITGYRAPSQDTVLIPTGRVGDAEAPRLSRQLDGVVTHIDYAVRPALATAQVGSYYANLLRAAGFETIFSCVGEAACGGGMGALIFNSGKVAPVGLADGLFGDRMRVIVARRDADWVLIHIYEGPDRTTIYETVVENAA
ncbi:hypothetical protein TPR58_06535 [Sphingomonas sp. HF-S3]|uniref:DUF4892 domain-containing protein n=1 Tax=Sphingomonas rustica TaxID=3103142 RepID=A0ABV0B9Q1_9SPHN